MARTRPWTRPEHEWRCCLPANDSIVITIGYRLTLTLTEAEEMVGRPCDPVDSEDDSWYGELEEKVQDLLPDLLSRTQDEPMVDAE